MKKNLFKRGMAGLLSLVMCLTALVGIGTTTAYAAGERAEVYLVSFPRSGDANIDYSGTWGHPNLRYMNGWHSGESKYTTIRAMHSYDGILETNDKGEIFIDGLRIGDYTISEVSNSASSMYVIPADKKATVKLGSTTIVEMHNVLRDTPKTGDTTNLPLLYALAGLSAAGIAVCGVIGFKKKKKEDRN